MPTTTRKLRRCYPAPSSVPQETWGIPERYLKDDDSRERCVRVLLSEYAAEIPSHLKEYAAAVFGQYLRGDWLALLTLADALKEEGADGDQQGTLCCICVNQAAKVIRTVLKKTTVPAMRELLRAYDAATATETPPINRAIVAEYLSRCKKER